MGDSQEKLNRQQTEEDEKADVGEEQMKEEEWNRNYRLGQEVKQQSVQRSNSVQLLLKVIRVDSGHDFR